MKRLKILAVTALLCLAGALPASANGIDPKADSLAIERMRRRMDRIREHRPTVALVLSGGGAKGAAHVGVIRYLESLDIPVDLVLGTSMGGLVGGLYAMGYTSEEMDAIVRHIDWNWALFDLVPSADKSYLRSKYEEKYILSMPFYYDKEYYQLRKMADPYFDDTVKPQNTVKLGADNRQNPELLKRNLLGSLPAGYVRGQNVSNLINSLTVGYQDSIDFFELPVPFVCVAADMVSGKAKIWYEGKINTAMRSTMSVPGLFAPVKVDGMVLVDGGLRNNYPTDLARKMGADIIIGVELSQQKKNYSDVNNIIDIVSQGIDMLGLNQFEENENLADVKIKPNLAGYNMMSFEKEKIDTIICRGYEAAVSQAEALGKVARLTAGKYKLPEKVPAVNIESGVDSILISQITIRGVSEKERNLLHENIHIKPGTFTDYEKIQQEVTRLYATQNYESVNFELLGTEEPYELVLHFQKGPIHNFGLGLRVDTEEIVSVLFNVGLFKHRLYGHTLDIVGKISVNPYLQLHWYYIQAGMPKINATANVRWTDLSLLDFGNKRYSMRMLSSQQSFFLSLPEIKKINANLGIRNEFYSIGQILGTSFNPNYDYGQRTNDYLSLFADFRMEKFDKKYFANKGYSVGGAYSWVFAGFPNNFNNFHIVSLDAKSIVSAEKCFSFIPSVNFRFLLGESNIPLAYFNVMGGALPGRYFQQQIPFVGTTNIVMTDRILTLFRTDFRFNVYENHYLTAMVNYAHSSDAFTTYLKHTGHVGCALEYSYNSIFGPLSASFQWSSLNKKKLGFYISLGYDF